MDKQSKLEFIGEFHIPTWALDYLEYGEHSDINDGDLKLVKNWLEQEFSEFKMLEFAWGSINSFNKFPAFGLPCSTFNTDVFGHKKNVRVLS